MMDTLQTITPGSGSNFWMIITLFVAIYEIVIRFIPTVADFTILGVLYRILDFLVENKAVIQPEDKLDKESRENLKQEGTKKRPIFRIAKRILKK